MAGLTAYHAGGKALPGIDTRARAPQVYIAEMKRATTSI
jgi:hypothetical protein